MSTDSGGRVRSPKSPDLKHLPEILSVTFHQVKYSPPRRYFVAGAERQLDAAVEVEVETSGPFQIRALGPVLFIGEIGLTEARTVHDRLYRFIAPEPSLLERGAPIALAWNGAKSSRRSTPFKYELPPQE